MSAVAFADVEIMDTLHNYIDKNRNTEAVNILKEIQQKEGDFSAWYKYSSCINYAASVGNFEFVKQVGMNAKDIFETSEYKQGPLILSINSIDAIVVLSKSGISLRKYFGFGSYNEKGILDHIKNESDRQLLIKYGAPEYNDYENDYNNGQFACSIDKIAVFTTPNLTGRQALKLIITLNFA
jgi:hypothetical protein